MIDPDIKTYLADSSENLRKILLDDAVFVRFDEFGNVILDGKFTAGDISIIHDQQAEVITRLAEMKKKQAGQRI